MKQWICIVALLAVFTGCQTPKPAASPSPTATVTPRFVDDTDQAINDAVTFIDQMSDKSNGPYMLIVHCYENLDVAGIVTARVNKLFNGDPPEIVAKVTDNYDIKNGDPYGGYRAVVIGLGCGKE